MKWRNAEGMLPIRLKRTISLAENPGSLVRFTFQNVVVLPVGIAPTTNRSEAGRSNLLSYGSLMKMVRRDGSAPPSPQCQCGDLLLI